MTLTPTGVEFITKGYASFVAQMAGASNAVANMGRMTQNRLAAIDKFNKAMGDMNSTMVKIARTGVAIEQEKTAQAFLRTAQAADRTKQALEKTKQVQDAVRIAYEKTRQSIERTTQSTERTTQTVERTKQAYERTKQAVERTVQALERTKQANARTTQAFERTKQAVERTVQAFERTKQALERTKQAQERTIQSFERTKQAIERTRTAWVVYRQEQERTKQAAMHMVNALAHTVTALFGAKTAVRGASSSLGDMVKGVFFGSALWDIVSNGIRKVTAGLTTMMRTATDAASKLQDITIRLETMIARQIRAAGVTDDLNESLKMSSSVTQEVLGWISELSLATPFSVDAISETLAFAAAMGWTVEQSKELTTSILDYSAAMGLTSETMDRIIFNFAQMKAAGKVTATEMRDLARGAFFPLTDILDIAAEKLGITGNGLIEFRKAAADGQIGVQDFFDAFIEYANRDFPGAARNLNSTLKAVKDNFQDFIKTAIGWKLLAPAIGLLSEKIAELLKKLTSPKALDTFERIGITLKFVMESLFSATNKVFTAIKGLFDALGIGLPTVKKITEAFVALGVFIEKVGDITAGFINVLENFVRTAQGNFRNLVTGLMGEAFNWGAGIIQNFAQGIVDTAVDVIVAAMKFVGNLLASFLESHSPPDILPDLPEWGANAMAEYLRGFTLADYSMLDSVQGLVEKSLNALVDLGALGEIAGKEMFLGISEGLIKAMAQLNETGSIGQEIFDQLQQIGGGLGKELATLLTRQVDLANATEKLAEAQQAYNDAVEATKKAQISVNDSIRKYNKMLREGASDADLAAQLKIVNAEEERLDAAVDQQVAAKESVEMWEKAIKPLEEAVKLQEKLISQLIELMEAQADLDEARRRAAAGGGIEEGDYGIDIPDFGFDDFDTVSGPLTGWFEKMKRDMKEKIGGIFDGIGVSISDAFAPISETLADIMEKLPSPEEMKRRWSAMASELKSAWADVPMTFDGILGAMGKSWDAFTIMFPGLPSTDEIASDLQWLFDWGEKAERILLPILKQLGFAFKLIYAVFTGEESTKAEGSLQKTLTTLLDIALAITTVGLGIVTLSWSVLSGLVTLAGHIIAGIKGMLSGAYEALASVLEGITSGIGDYITGIILQVQGLWDIIVGIFTLDGQKIKEGWDTLWNGIVLSFVGFWGTFYNLLTGFIQIVIGAISGFVESIITFFLDLYDELVGNSIIPDMLDDIYNAFVTVFTDLKTFVTDIFGEIAGFIADTAGSIMGDVGDAIDLVGELLGLSSGGLNSMPNTDYTLNSTTRPAGTVSAPPTQIAASPVSGTPGSGGTTISFGDTIISNNMDAAEFRSSVIRVIRENI